MRGAWIEIHHPIVNYCKLRRRSPCGERGLKFQFPAARLPTIQSLPMRGAWIEIHNITSLIRMLSVAPHAGSVD